MADDLNKPNDANRALQARVEYWNSFRNVHVHAALRAAPAPVG